MDTLNLITEKPPGRGAPWFLLTSLVIHGALIAWFASHVQPLPRSQDVPIARYIEIMKTPPVTDGPGPSRKDTSRLDAPRSDANRRAASPRPTGPERVDRPGIAGGSSLPQNSPQRYASAASPPRQRSPRADSPNESPVSRTEPARPDRSAAASASPTSGEQIDWRSAIERVAKIASLDPGSIELGSGGGNGGNAGFAEEGPISFESQWFDWGDYSVSMVRRIRVNWHANMPDLLRAGVQGVVTIRFTILRNGSITEVTTLKSSGIPPYDFAARKAIELSSPLNKLPANFPKESERVTAQFFYNSRPVR